MSKQPDHYANEKGGQFKELKLKDKQQEEFHKVFKTGIYKELYQKKMLTETQLSYLLNRIGF